MTGHAPVRQSQTALTDEQQAVLRFLAPAQGEGTTLANDVANECDIAPRAAGSKLRALERRGLVRSTYYPDIRLHGWEVTDEGWKAADPAHNFVFSGPRSPVLA